MKKTIEHLPVFVYGTLLPGHRNYTRMFQKIKPINETPGLLDEHVLVIRDGVRSPFPYLSSVGDLPTFWFEHVGEAECTVNGVLLYFDKEDFPTILTELDYLEGVPHHYNRKIVDVNVDRATVRAYVYYADTALVKELLPDPFVPNGDWDAFEKARTPKANARK